MNIIIALLIFGLVVTIHEFGHFLLAKKGGIGVTEFSVGMGPRLFSFDFKGTKYSLKLLPLGGSCMMVGEDCANDQENAFNNKPIWSRISTIFAGPFFNFVLAFIISMIIIGMNGFDIAKITGFSENSNASVSGLKEGDIITELDGKNVVFARDVDLYLTFSPLASTEPLIVKIKRDGKTETVSLTPDYTEKMMLGFYYDPTTSQVLQVMPDSAMEEAGVSAEDTIIAIDETKLTASYTLADYLNDHPLMDEEVSLTYEHNGRTHESVLKPRMTKVYSLGFTYGELEKATVWQTIRYSFSEVRYWIEATVKSLGQLITGKVSPKELGGPVRIVSEIGSVVDEKDSIGVRNVVLLLLQWTVILSANLGVMNLLPIPALDGGRLVFLILEAVRGKPIDPDKEGLVHTIGFILLMVLMVFIFANDIKNVFF